MSAQFIHLDNFGRSPRANAPKWATISGVLSEAGRVAGAVGHIATPVPPAILYGVAPEALLDEAEGLAHTAVDAKGRKLRCDGAVLIAGVASYPATVEELHVDPVEKDAYYLWRSETIKWLKSIFGASLRSVVEHEDEPRAHLHFFILPSLTQNNTLNWSGAHPGLAAKRSAAQAKQDKKSQDRAYRGAMRAFQDAYYNAVSDFFHHQRFGPRRARVSRMERKAQIELEAERAAMLHEVRTAEHEALLNAEYQGRERVREEMSATQNALDQARRDVEHERARAERAEEEIERLRAMFAEMVGSDLSM
ncbi:hypothetical protein [Methylosinus sp. LW4]|uniref:hypothetical protein n=1 Tax=Methylosinus sp. LW4 TaxID=136993 RepID=UPI0012FA3051|nr:hypothetical protein [Methylosinus sp. LW4]